MNASRCMFTAASLALRRSPSIRLSHSAHRPTSTSSEPHRPTILLAAFAGLTASTFVYADLAAYAPPQSSSTTPASTHASKPNWSPLAHEIAACSPLAVQNLAVLAADVSSHPGLIDSGVIHALAVALRNRADLKDTDAGPLLVGLLNVLADLTKREGTHSACVDSGIPLLLQQLLQEYPPVSGNAFGWWGWLTSWIGLANKNTPHPLPPLSDSQTKYSNINEDSSSQSLPSGLDVDLSAGISYHTVRCLSNLAKNSSMHPMLEPTKVLRDLVSTITLSDPSDLASGNDEQRIDTLRCAILAVAALSKSVPEDVVALGGDKRLIAFMTQRVDSVAQMYAAGGVRNLARHPEEESQKWNVHRQLVVHGVANALASGMSAKTTPQTQSFAALAFADLMSTRHGKAHLIQSRLQPAYEPYTLLMRSTNQSITRAVYRTLVSLYDGDDGQKRQSIPENLSCLIAEESGLLINGAVARGDVGALRAVRAMCHDKLVAQRLVDKGALEVLIRGARKGKGEYWEECTSALSLLSELPEIGSLISSRGALKAVLLRPCPNQSSKWATSLFANMARNDEYRAEIAYGGLSTILMSLSSKDEESRLQGARAMYNLSLGGISKVLIRQGGSLIPLVKAVSTSGETRRLAIGALAGISEAYEQPSQLIEADVVSVLLSAAREEPSVTKDVAFCFCQMSQFMDVHGSLARSGAAAWLVDVISRNGGSGPDSTEAMLYATLAVCNIAYSEGITRTVLRDSGAIRILTALTASGMSATHVLHGAKQALLNIRGKEQPSVMPVDGIARSNVPA